MNASIATVVLKPEIRNSDPWIKRMPQNRYWYSKRDILRQESEIRNPGLNERCKIYNKM